MRVYQRYPERLKDQREFFDTLITEEWWDYHGEDWVTSRLFEISCLFDAIQPKTILDLGCGCGFHDKEMAEYPFVARVDAVDYSGKSVEKANEAYPHPKVVRWCADFVNDPLQGSYDCVASFQVIEHIENPDIYFSAAARLCNHEGYVAVFTPNWNRLSNILLRLRGKAPNVCDSQHFQEYTFSSLRLAGKRHGLTPYASFGYSLGGLAAIDRQDIETRLRWGKRFAFAANGICQIFKNNNGQQCQYT